MAKPTLGYPTRTAAVLALRSQGRNTQQIADLIGITTSTVSALEESAQRKVIRAGGEGTGRALLLPEDILDKVGRHAARRGITPNNLVRRLVERVVDDNLIDAVLDDADEVAA